MESSLGQASPTTSSSTEEEVAQAEAAGGKGIIMLALLCGTVIVTVAIWRGIFVANDVNGWLNLMFGGVIGSAATAVYAKIRGG